MERLNRMTFCYDLMVLVCFFFISFLSFAITGLLFTVGHCHVPPSHVSKRKCPHIQLYTFVILYYIIIITNHCIVDLIRAQCNTVSACGSYVYQFCVISTCPPFKFFRVHRAVSNFSLECVMCLFESSNP